MGKFVLKIKKNRQKGDLAYEYSPLMNMRRKEQVNDGDKSVEKNIVGEFDTDQISHDVLHPVDIECQPSYDGSVNIITNDDKNPPRLVNSAFSVLEDNTYKRVIRNQTKQTNYYNQETISSETMLQRVTSTFCRFELDSITEGGVCAGGNYIFYLRYSDEDDNLSPFVATSSNILVYMGSLKSIDSIYGTIESTPTDKVINLKIVDLDTAFNKCKLYYSREFSDANGIQKTETKEIVEPYAIKNSELEISFTGFEETRTIDASELNIKYNIYDRIKTQAQVQNMLFFGNVDSVTPDFTKLQDLAYFIQVSPVANKNINCVKEDYVNNGDGEYYNSNNVYNYTGYIPGEWYRLGVVFILDNDQCTEAYNLLGCYFDDLNDINTNSVYFGSSNIDQHELFMTDIKTKKVDKKYNTKGVFRVPDTNLYQNGDVWPISFEFTIQTNIINELKAMGVKGLFFVRQKRIPIFITQGLGIYISPNSHTPLIPSKTDDGEQCYFTQGCVNDKNNLAVRNIVLSGNEYRSIKSSNAMICQEVLLNKNLQSLFNGSEFNVKQIGVYNTKNFASKVFSSDDNGQSVIDQDRNVTAVMQYNSNHSCTRQKLVFIPPETPSMIIDSFYFSTKAGSSESLLDLRSLAWGDSDVNKRLDGKVIRGNFGAYIGIASNDGIATSGIFNIYTLEYDESDEFHEKIIKVRAQDQSEYSEITDRMSLDYFINNNNDEVSLNAYRGDCFTGLISCKMQYNFLDSNMPLNTNIFNTSAFGGKKKLSELAGNTEASVSSWNAVPLGWTLTYRYMSSMNLAIRSIDEQYIDERALYGGYRDFYPHSKFTYSANWKLPESSILNFGLSNNRNKIHFFEHPNVPYIKDVFDTRVAFSNIQVDNAFKNSYRIFQGLSFQDLERTYGALTKLLPLGANLLGVFEHGIGIIPVNEKALLKTTTGQNIHMYGAGVLQNQITVISQDYGSTWEDSIIVTPDGVYGVDTFAKKIWKYNAKGLQLISDQVINSFLNDNLDLSESDKAPIIAYRNVKSHYNNFKGDVMFTFYNGNKTWNLCFNERINKWTTRYSWTPLLSENIQNSFVSIDQQAAEIYSGLARQINPQTNGLIMADQGLGKTRSRYKYYFDNDTKTFGTISKKDFTYINYIGGTIQDNKEIIHEVKPVPETLAFQLYGWGDLYNDMIANIKSIDIPMWDQESGKWIIISLTPFNCEVISNQDVTLYRWTNNGNTNEVLINCDGANMNVRLSINNEFIPWIKVNTIILPRMIKTQINQNDNTRVGETKTPTYPMKWGCWKSIDDLYVFSGDQTVSGRTFSIKADEFNKKYRESISEFIIEGDENIYHGIIDRNSIDDGKELENSLIYLIDDTDNNSNEDVFDYDKELEEAYEEAPKLDIEYEGKPFSQTLYLVADWDSIKSYDSNKSWPSEELIKSMQKQFNETLRLGIYTHGRAGNYNEIDYNDESFDNQILPTRWYNRQEPFEIEFVVNTSTGMQKIFNNLVLLSNNVQPNEIEYEIIGDAYGFNKSGIFSKENFVELKYDSDLKPKFDEYYADKLAKEFNGTKDSQDLEFSYGKGKFATKFKTEVCRDTVLNQYTLKVTDEMKNIKEYGRLLGNIEYKEDKWNVVISPIHYKKKKLIKDLQETVIYPVENNCNENDESCINRAYEESYDSYYKVGQVEAAKLRDKWMKVRIKYNGDKLVVITAIQSMLAISYA